MRALQDFFSTDYGLMSFTVIAITLGMGVFYAGYFIKHVRDEGRRWDAAHPSR